MRRIVEPAAYGAAPVAECWWAATVETPHWPAPQGEIAADVAVIGGGFTGLSAALHLAEAGVDVALCEAEAPFWGASGRNGGFCCLGGSKLSDAALTRRFGAPGAQGWRDAQRASVDFTSGLIDRLDLDVDRHSEGETLLAHRPQDWERLQREAEEVEAGYGVTPRLVPAADLADAGMAGPFHGALTVPLGFALNPRKYAAGLARAAQAAGARLFAPAPVTSLRADGSGYVLGLPGARLRARRVILATNGYSSEDVPAWMRARYMPVASNVIVTRPLEGDELQAAGWTTAQMAYDTRHLLHYFRLMPDNRFLFGMRGGIYATPRETARLARTIRADFEAMFPAWRDVETPHLWSGLVCLTPTLLPYVGPVPEMPGVFAGFGYHGNGVAMGGYAGRILADLVQDRLPGAPYPEAMRRVPGRFPLGRFRRAALVPAYASFGWRDR
ncbi:NAD(P)/FAD-dependent oxidoreductase [Rhodosalinus sp. 5P4]|uniref:NAD(P)/FAD-dependent oxidoreductase n=1 Tax=Rhodosalinus sp. 5P4 TaxID=3239196 RepID=UPI00352516D4